MRISLFLFAFIILQIRGLAGTPKPAPDWVQDSAATNLGPYDGVVPAVVLLKEEHLTVDASGTLVTHIREVIKILSHSGNADAAALIPYFRGGSRVRSLSAWLVAPDGFVKTFDKNSIVDFGEYDDMELYNDLRFARIKADNPEIGSVFAYEAVIEQRMLFGDDQYAFQSALPTVQSRYVLDLPAGWQAQSVLLNHAAIQPVVSGSTYTWTLRDLPFHRQEDHAPEVLSSVPTLAVSFFPADKTSDFNRICFRSWADVSRWHTSFSAPQADVSPELTNKVRELVAGEKDEMGRIGAIARYVQQIKYVAIDMDELHGGGYKPHPATLVFRQQYGDCKDKANLMRAMLKIAGIDSYLVAIYSGDRTHVHSEWPSPTQFNHMIIAVRVAENVNVPTVLSAPSLGQQLVIFDPTSETTELGDLPWYEQGSSALLMAGENGGILRMPVLPPEASGTEVSINAELSNSGGLKARYVLTETGQYASGERARKLYGSAADYRHHLEELFSERVRMAQLKSVAEQDSGNGRYTITADLESPNFGQSMGGGILVINSSFLTPFSSTFPAASSRMQPILLRAGLHRKHIVLKLPQGFKVDEMPVSVSEAKAWGSFSVTYQQKPGEVLVEETVNVKQSTLPAEQYKKIKNFFDHLNGADEQQAVLMKE
jgi:hypothetical protein